MASACLDMVRAMRFVKDLFKSPIQKALEDVRKLYGTDVYRYLAVQELIIDAADLQEEDMIAVDDDFPQYGDGVLFDARKYMFIAVHLYNIRNHYFYLFVIFILCMSIYQAV